MSKLTDFGAALAASNDRIEKAVDGISADLKGLNDLITKLQSTQGQITAEDQKLLDEIQARGEAIAVRLEAVDLQTPPVPATA